MLSTLQNNRNYIVAGPALPGHAALTATGTTAITGRTIPWNTYALWDVRSLALTGFPLVTEGVHGEQRVLFTPALCTHVCAGAN